MLCKSRCFIGASAVLVTVLIPGRQSVDRSSVMPAKAGIQANAAEYGAARLDSRLRGSDESGQRTGSLV